MGCGFGQQSRVLECRYTNDLSPADKSCCAGVVQPPMQRECWSTEEQNCSAFWDMGEFGKVIDTRVQRQFNIDLAATLIINVAVTLPLQH